MSDVTLLRKLTLKSLLKFGKYADIPIGNLIDDRKTMYLRWVYFNSDKITFVDEILELIYIPQEYRIEKPGKNPELNKTLNEEIKQRISFFEKEHHKKKAKYAIKAQASMVNREVGIKTSKASLTRKNQGH